MKVIFTIEEKMMLLELFFERKLPDDKWLEIMKSVREELINVKKDKNV